MATRTRDNIPVRERDKSRMPPTQLPQTGTVQHPRRNLNPSKITSSAQNQDSTASQRQNPTHLKSTKTPTTNVPKKQSKRPTTGDNAHKPTPIRKSTFDDPSSPSTTQNTRVQPTPALRPSSFSSTTQKTGPARKPSSQYTRHVGIVKRRFIYVKKQDIGTSAAATKEQLRSPPEKVEVSNAYVVLQPELNPKDQQSSINEAKEEDAIQVGSSTNEPKADVLVQEDPEPIINATTKAENNDKDVNPNTSESSMLSERQDITLAVKTEATEDVPQVPETVSNNQEFPQAHNINEVNSSKTDESVADNRVPEVEEMSKEPARTVSDKKEVVGTENEVGHSKETEAQEVAREEKREIAKVPAQTQVTKGKRESVVSNDVIEETASKLREQRKNKVKALAGAFETVISLQEQK